MKEEDGSGGENVVFLRAAAVSDRFLSVTSFATTETPRVDG